MDNLTESFSNFNDSTAKNKKKYSGLMGLAIDGSRKVNVEGRPGFVYIRIRDSLSEAVQAYNDKVSPVYNFPVLIERKNNRWYVTGKDDARYDTFGTSAPYLPAHGNQHSFNRDAGTGGDTVFVYPDQFMPLLVYPSGTTGANNLLIAPYVLQRTSDFIYVGNTGTRNLLIHKPTNSTAIMGLVGIDRVTGNPSILIASGTPLTGTITGTSSVVPYLPYPTSNFEPLYAFRLVSGTTALTWNNLYNVRQFFGGTSTSTGTSSGGTSGIVAWDEGVVKGTGTVMDFVGANVDVSVSGSVIRVFVTGSSGGSLPAFVTGSIPYAASDGSLTENNQLLWWDATNRGLRLGRSTRFDLADIFPIGITAKNPDEIISVGMLAYGTGSSGAPYPQFQGYRARGIPATPLPVRTGDIFASFIGRGYDGGSYAAQARMNFFATGEMVTGTYAPTGVDFLAIPSGSSTIRSFLTLYGDSINLPTGSTYNVGGIPHQHPEIRYEYAFASYINISPLTATNSFPFSSTLPSFTTYPKQYSQAVFIAAGTNNASNYWTLALIDAGTSTTIASVSTQGLAANAGYTLIDNTMALSSLNQTTHKYIYILATKTGSPANLNVHCPSVEYTLN